MKNYLQGLNVLGGVSLPQKQIHVTVLGAGDPTKVLDALGTRYAQALIKYGDARKRLTAGWETIDPTRQGYVLAYDRMIDEWKANYQAAFETNNDQAREIAVKAVEGVATKFSNELIDNRFTGIAPRDEPNSNKGLPGWAIGLIVAAAAAGGIFLLTPVAVALISRSKQPGGSK